MKKILTLLAIFSTLVNFAQVNDTTNINILNEVTITSSRFKLESVAQKTIKMDSVKNYYAQETPYFFSTTPSVVTQSDNGTPFGYSYFTLRGMGQNRINYTLNGVPLNDGEDLAVYTSNYTDLLNSLRSVQITRGSGVSSNGSSSYIGLVNMDLTSPFDKRSGEITTMIGSFNSRKNSFKFNTGTNKNGFGANFRISETYTDGFRDFSSGRSVSFSTSLGYRNEYTSARFNVVYGKTKNGQSWLPVPEGSPVTTNILTTYFGIKPQYDDFNSGLYQFQLAGKFSEQTIFNFSTYITQVNGNYDMPSFTDAQQTNNLKLNSTNSGFYYNVKHESNGFVIEPGITINAYSRKHIGTTDGLFQYENIGDKFDATAFTKVSYKLGTAWIVDGDYQFRNTKFNYRNKLVNFESKVFEHKFNNFSVGISYRGNEIFKPYVSFGKSSREPSRTNLFFYTDNPTSDSEIINVKPETVRDLELGTKINSKYVKGSFNIYSMYFTDEIVSIGQLNSMGIALGTNATKSNRLGVEGDITLKLKKLEIGSTFNISKNKVWLNDTKSEPVLTPNFISNVFVNYKTGKFEFGINYKYVTQSFLDNSNTFICPEYHLVDTNVIFNINSDLSIKLFVNNILNKNWTTGGTSDPIYGRSFYYTSGINSYLTLNYKF